MKLRTHYIFSAGLISLILSLLLKVNFFYDLSTIISSLFKINPSNNITTLGVDPSNTSETIFLLFNYIITTFFFNYFVMAFTISYLGNKIVDKLGHKRVRNENGEISVRIPRTHTFPRSVAWGLLSTLPYWIYLILVLYFASTLFKLTSYQ